ncbi:hypothetical protein O181_032612 [Austropuccinia psidii MF-1]|uniref:Uncharacterized protein n=1 Tax=Austropuccinia psidii MF-1 TaxID=1389203 RepID=A0A9Q3H6E4_9BASI|nr:hypothetical protein [Austropuccinia psidii MF-1]
MLEAFFSLGQTLSTSRIKNLNFLVIIICLARGCQNHKEQMVVVQKEKSQSVQSVFSSWLKNFSGRRTQCIRMMHSKPEDFINEDGPNQSPKTFPAALGKVRFYIPGPSQWAQAMRVKIWSKDPLEPWHMGPVWTWGTLLTPMDRKL